MTDLQRISTLTQASSIDDLKIGQDGGLQKRSTVSVLCHKIADSWRSRSLEGRAAIAARDSAILEAMGKAVESHAADAAGLRPQLRTIQQKITDAAADRQERLFREIADPLLDGLPPALQRDLRSALEMTAQTDPIGLWSGKMKAVSELFHALHSQAADVAHSLGTMADQLGTEFLSIVTQKNIGEDGIHPDLLSAAPRIVIGSSRPSDGAAGAEALKTMLHDHADLLPFISMAAARLADAPVSRTSLPLDALGASGFLPMEPARDISIRREGRNLYLVATQVQDFAISGEEGSEPGGLAKKDSFILHIRLDETPRHIESFGSSVSMPKFTLDGSSTLTHSIPQA